MTSLVGSKLGVARPHKSESRFENHFYEEFDNELFSMEN